MLQDSGIKNETRPLLAFPTINSAVSVSIACGAAGISAGIDSNRYLCKKNVKIP